MAIERSGASAVFFALAKPDDSSRILLNGKGAPHRDGFIHSIRALHPDEVVNKENNSTYEAFREALYNDYGELGSKAFAAIEHRLTHHRRLTSNDIYKVQLTLLALKQNPVGFSRLQNDLSQLGECNEFKQIMRDNFSADFAKSYIGKKIRQFINKIKEVLNPLTLLTLLPFGIGNIINIGENSTSVISKSNKSRFLDQVKRAASNPYLNKVVNRSDGSESRLDLSFCTHIAAVMADGYDRQAEKTATAMTLNTVFLPLGSIASKGVGPVIESAISERVASSVAANILNTGQSTAMSLFEGEVEDAIGKLNRAKDSICLQLPHIILKESGIDFSLGRDKVIAVLLKYLGPAKRDHLLGPDVDVSVSAAEQARLNLRQRLGCPDYEALTDSYQPTHADRVFYKTLFGSGRELTGAVGGAMMAIYHKNQARHPDTLALQQDFIQNGGHPNFLKMLYIAAGWINPDI